MTDEDFVRWAAGFFDGEGWIAVYEGKTGGFQARVGIGNIRPVPLAFIAQRWGGRIGVHRRSRPRRDLYLWVIENQPEIAVFLAAIRPFLLIKGSEADVMLVFCRSPRKRIPEVRRAAAKKLRELKWR